MATRITIDPITRIEGHLRVDAQVDEGRVTDAWSSCTMWRGLETILLGRDAREAWLFTQRFCGVCTTVHAIASVRAVEDALGLHVPANAQSIRNLILIGHALHDHIVHFYHLSALDWVDVATLPQADPAKAVALGQALSTWEGNSLEAMRHVRKKIKATLDSGRHGIFAHGYWGHPAMKLAPEVNLLAVAHYLQAIDVQRKANQVVGLLGGKTPHIQNMAVGGVANAVDLDSQAALNMDRLYQLKALLDDVVPFVQEVYFKDCCAIAANYTEWFGYGAGARNYLAVADLPTDSPASQFDLPGGSLTDGDPGTLHTMDDWRDGAFRKHVTEDVARSWYRGHGPRSPFEEDTVPEFTGRREDAEYSWVKAPRLGARPMEVGPLAQVLIGYHAGNPLIRTWTDRALALIGELAGETIEVPRLMSTMGRHVARAIRAAVLAELALKHWTLLAENVLRGDTAVFVEPEFPAGETSGVGLHEAPRGALSHWVVLEGRTIRNYQAVVPTTWNASPRDAQGVPGPYEHALRDNPVADPELPLEVLRTVHSFDPCMACACHTYDRHGRALGGSRVP